MPGKSNAAKYSISLAAEYPDPWVRLHVGCGGSTSKWKKTLLTTHFRTRSGYTENRKCATTSANGSAACSPSTHGPSTSGSGGTPGSSIDGAYRKWKEFTGYWPKIGGNAAQMDDKATAAGFHVSSVPHAMSMVVFNSAGHVAWVTKVHKSGNTVKFDYTEMNRGKWDTQTGRTWDPADQRFIVAPT
jgi:surface antigen